jgi:multidrug efflux pump subunit AcrB
LKSLLTFVGGGGPRFWFSLAPEPRQQNYAQIVVELTDKHATHLLIEHLQDALSSQIPGARFNARLLETGPPVGNPVALRLVGDDRELLKRYGDRLEDIFRHNPYAERVQNDWGSERLMVRLEIDPDRANLAGVTNADVALSTALAMNGRKLGDLREKDKEIPVVLRMVQEDRARLSDLGNLYVYSSKGPGHVPMRQVSRLETEMGLETIARRKQFRTLTVSCFPIQGHLASEVLKSSREAIAELTRQLPAGLRLEVGGEQEKQQDGFRELALVMAISIILIFLALVAQFRNAVKPFIVFAAIPYGIVGALVALWVTGTPFGFMAFLGVASLVGVIVSHVIVLFDFIEEARVEGKPLTEALLDAGIVRLRPVLITVGATVFALFPLASHGGPLWEPLCYAQIGGLCFATVITLLLVPVIYSIAVLDLKILRWP